MNTEVKLKAGIDAALYDKVHRWVHKNFGKASKCEFCTVKNKRFHWAKKKDCDYDFKRENFIELCPSCHVAYDYTETTRQKVSEYMKKNNPHKGKSITGADHPSAKPVDKLDMNGNFIENYLCIKDAAIANNIDYRKITDCVRGSKKSGAGFKWRYANKIN